MDFRKGLLAVLVVAVVLLSGCMSPEKEEKPSHLGDVVPPQISLISPANNSFISQGDILKFNISDPELDTVIYSLNNDTWHSLAAPYEIDADSWTEGEYTVKIKATDASNNTATASYRFEIDLTEPKIELVSPPDNSAMESGTYIVFNITDRNLMGANYSLDGGRPQCLPSPFGISTLWWTEGKHLLKVSALDMAMNSNTSTFTFWIDNKNTSIRLISPSIRVFRAGTDMLFSVEESTLENISYSINGGKEIQWSSPWTISTDGWKDGTYSITIKATDKAGHRVIRTYQIEIDNIPPSINMSLRNITVNAYLDERNYSFWKEKQTIKTNVSDAHLKWVLYSVNGGEFSVLKEPYLIDPAVWRGKAVNLTLKAEDLAGNEAEKTFKCNLSFILKIYTGCNYSLTNYSDISIPFFIGEYLFSLDSSYDKYIKNASGTNWDYVSAELVSAFEEHGIHLNSTSAKVIRDGYMRYWEWKIVNDSTTYRIENVSGKLNIYIEYSRKTRDVFRCIDGTENGTYYKIYDGAGHTFNVNRGDRFNDLKTIAPWMGLSISISSKVANFTTAGILPSNWTIQLKEGKNFVSYPSMNPMRVDRALQGVPWYIVQRWDWETQSYVDMRGSDIMLPGYAYWIYVSYDCNWVVDF